MSGAQPLLSPRRARRGTDSWEKRVRISNCNEGTDEGEGGAGAGAGQILLRSVESGMVVVVCMMLVPLFVPELPELPKLGFEGCGAILSGCCNG